MNFFQATSVSAAMLMAVAAAPALADGNNFTLHLDGQSEPEQSELLPNIATPEGLDFPNYIIGENSCYIPKPQELLMS